MEVKADYAWNSIHTSRKNSPLLPSNIRALIIGKINCGKTTLLMNFLLEPNWLDYTHLYVFGRSLHQLEYKIIKKAIYQFLEKIRPFIGYSQILLQPRYFGQRNSKHFCRRLSK